MNERRLWKFRGRAPMPTPQGWIAAYIWQHPDYEDGSYYVEVNHFWGRPIHVFPPGTPIKEVVARG